MEFKEATTPSLTLDPFNEAAKAEIIKPEAQVIEETPLSPEELQMVANFAKQINLDDATAILQYGAGTQKKMADFSQDALERVRSKDLGEVGQLLSNVVVELKNFDTDEEEKGLFGIFKKGKNKIESMKAKYNKVENNVEAICDALENHQMTLLKDIAVLDKMYEANKTYFKEISMYIMAGKQCLEQTRTGSLQNLIDKARITGLPEDAQAAKDLESKCERFEKKLYDLELTRTICIQTAPQIRMVQNNNSMMVEKIQSTIVNTIPLWKSQMVLALGVEHSHQAIKAQNEVNDMTNELLRRNADKLQMATIETAKATERGIVDIETLQHTNQTLISTLDEVMNIQQEGREKRAAAEIELRKMEGELKNKLLEIVR